MNFNNTSFCKIVYNKIRGWEETSNNCLWIHIKSREINYIDDLDFFHVEIDK